MVRAYIGLGANLGDARRALLDAAAELNHLPETEVVAVSSLYRTAPVGYAHQPDFINGVAAVDTQLGPRALLDALLQLEQDWGRERSFRNAPRTLDLDVLLYGDQTVDEAGLHVPHPRLHERAFVLVPLAEIAPHLVLPDGRAIAALLHGVADQDITRIEEE
ncbi:2-amino-4-hydroxy-6-hydroxymethyldihydropteridine diphosphokinase [Uliginosibacterium sp. H1]|uniref:2-amino-4-hydroxy-6- hydroxymethyldihydropteridine diphosphokinase n=1 Tax=Uliginosibacterium sp. H1 TaxID=3114757 RepID=UPI002E198E93|nr:2-amino-4-hydroxy-6-hydroxymethyldihydropteridine diphosphokinase [Uliginosibacterium sp. H1]